jgi:hypothetical protein
MEFTTHPETYISFNDDKGAALILPFEAYRKDTLHMWCFKKHMLDNYRKWHEFAVTQCSDIGMSVLVLVTGCDMTRQWTMATHDRRDKDANGFYLSPGCTPTVVFRTA